MFSSGEASMTYTDDMPPRLARRGRILGAMTVALALAGCGHLGRVPLASGGFNVYGDGAYADDAAVAREAMFVCPAGYEKLSVDDRPGPAELGRTLIWHIACNGNSK
jgi:hypothetical protein